MKSISALRLCLYRQATRPKKNQTLPSGDSDHNPPQRVVQALAQDEQVTVQPSVQTVPAVGSSGPQDTVPVASLQSANLPEDPYHPGM